MKTTKKSAVLILALAMVFMLFGITASAEGELTFGDYSYVLLEDGSVKITAYNGTEVAVTVPDKIDEKDVTVIGGGTFDQNSVIESLVLPGSVKTVEDNAVTFCSKLNTVTINEGALTELPVRAIKNCAALKTVKIPSNVTSIGTFEQCLALDNITVASGNKSLKNSGGVIFSADMKTLIKFPQGKNVKEYYIPTSVTKIAKNAFYEVQNPVKVYIPVSVKEMEGMPFAYSKVTLHYEGSSIPSAWKEAVDGFKVTLNAYKLGKTDKITSTCGANTIKLKWNAVYGATCYNVYRKTSSGWKKIAEVKGTSYNVKNTQYGTKYTFAVKAGKTSGGKTTWASTYTTHTVVAKIPKTTKITSTQTENSIKLTWNAVKGVDGYRVFVKNSSGWKTLATVSATTYTYKSLKAGTSYTFAVKAYKKISGKVTWSDVYTTHTTVTNPAAPSKVTATQGNDWIKLTWNASKGATAYRIYYKNGNKWSVAKNSVTGTTYTFEKLAAGTKRTYAVRPYIKNGDTVVWGKYTSYTAAVKPAATNVTVTSPSVGQIKVKWTAVKGATEYRVFYKRNNGSYKLYKTYTSPQSLTFKNLTSGVTYTFVVRAGVKTTAGVVLGSYTPKNIMVPYKSTKYLNMFKSGVFAMAYTVDGVTQVMYFNGHSMRFEGVNEKGQSVGYLYLAGEKQWFYLNHSTYFRDPLTEEEAKNFPVPSEFAALLSEITIPSSFKKTTYKENGYTYDVEYYEEDGAQIGFYYYGTKLVGIEEVNEKGEGIFILVHDITDKLPSDTFQLPLYDEW